MPVHPSIEFSAMRTLTTVVFASILVFGCKAGENTSTMKTKQDDGSSVYVLDVMPGGPEIPADARPTIQIEDGRVTGFAGCNRYNGPIEMTDNAVSIGPLAATKMYCADKMDLETAVLQRLQNADVLMDLGEDLMFEADGEMTLYFIRQTPAQDEEE